MSFKHNIMNPRYYLAANAPATRPFPKAEQSKQFTNGVEPVAVIAEYGAELGYRIVELANGEYLKVETNKGYLVPRSQVE